MAEKHISVFNFKEVIKELKKADKISKKIANDVIKDVRSRAPSWVSQSVRTVYGIKAKDILPPKTEQGKGVAKIKFKGKTFKRLRMVYKGRLLTATHFNAGPKEIPKKKYKVKATIHKGQRKVLGKSVFLGSNKKKKKGGINENVGYIPFQRMTDKAYPIEAVRTVSLPQMIDNEQVNKEISKKLTIGIEKRFEHAKSRYWK